MMQDIYKMQLHDLKFIDGVAITRVAGGWIYDFPSRNGYVGGVVFVPFHNEFMKGSHD